VAFVEILLFVIQKAMSRRQSLLHIALAVLVTLASPAAQAARGLDLTRQYLAAYDRNCALRSADARVLRRHNVLFVPGYLAGRNPAYFAEQIDWLHSIDVQTTKVAIRAGQSIAINGSIIAATIRNSTKPVILITHSKGSVDALEALRTEPALQAKVRAWVSLQGVFFGSPLADILLDGTLLNPVISDTILGFLGGTRQSAEDLTTKAALAYYRKHRTAISTVLRKVRSIAFASNLDGAEAARVKSLLEIPHELMRHEGIPNDGLVPVDSAVLPGMDFVKVSGVDHIAPVMPALQDFDRIGMTKTLLSLVLRAPNTVPFRNSVCRN